MVGVGVAVGVAVVVGVGVGVVVVVGVAVGVAVVVGVVVAVKMTEIRRDRWGKPLIVPPEGGKPIPYKRASSFGKNLDDTTNLTKWKQRKTVEGFLDNPHLQLGFRTARDNRAVNDLCEQAMTLAGAGVRADVGTGVHALTEMLDRREPVPYLAGYEDDVEAYAEVTTGMEMLLIEQFVVNDELRAAGTPDRIVEFEGENYVFDLKTGSVDYSGGFAVQLAIYAHSQQYDPATCERTPLPEVNKEKAIICHLPAGQGVCTLHWIDIARGYQGAHVAATVDLWRKERNLLIPFDKKEAA